MTKNRTLKVIASLALAVSLVVMYPLSALSADLPEIPETPDAEVVEEIVDGGLVGPEEPVLQAAALGGGMSIQSITKSVTLSKDSSSSVRISGYLSLMPSQSVTYTIFLKKLVGGSWQPFLSYPMSGSGTYVSFDKYPSVDVGYIYMVEVVGTASVDGGFSFSSSTLAMM